MYKLERYTSLKKDEWDSLVDKSRNGTFLFKRDYMDYHSDRFQDISLMLYRKNKLEAIFPANINDKSIYSHQGLTYGGIIYTSKITTMDILEMFDLVIEYFQSIGVKEIVYKSIPYIYTELPAQEDVYALYKNNFKLIGCNISSTVFLRNKIAFSESRKSGIRKAKKNNLIVILSNEFHLFWDILNYNLNEEYETKPVHSLDEINLLVTKFSENIKLYLVYDKNIPLAGTVLYINKNVVHVQYISASSEGKNKGALDLLFDELINSIYTKYEYFDFGHSTEKMGKYLNENLIFQKEGFGGRGVVYNIYKKSL